MIKLNVGCGADYRNGFINIDGSLILDNVDKRIDLSAESLLQYFESNSVDCILANDIIEHLFHWEAVLLLNDFYNLLKNGGYCEIRVPDCEYIISSELSISEKLLLLFGGQDIPQKMNEEMDKSRKMFPHFFCHKYGWTIEKIKKELTIIGFENIKFKKENTNFITTAMKK